MIKDNAVHPMHRESGRERMNKVFTIDVDGIDVRPNPLRPLDDERVKQIASSMARIGLMNPITVRYHEERPDYLPDDDTTDAYELVAGRHRLAAAKSLGWDRIDVDQIKCSDTEARLWEISENLHRAELSALQRSEQIALWIELTEAQEVLSQVATKPNVDRLPDQSEPKKVTSKGGRPQSGVRAAARELGVGKDDAHRAVKVASLSDEAKAAAIEHGLDDNRSVLLAAAKETDPAKQVKKIVEQAKAWRKTAAQCTPKEMAERRRIALIHNAENARSAAHLMEGTKIDETLIQCAEQTAAAWCELVDKLKKAQTKTKVPLMPLDAVKQAMEADKEVAQLLINFGCNLREIKAASMRAI